MAVTAGTIGEAPALPAQAAILARPATNERRMADAIRALAIDAVEAAKSGHPGMPMGMADAATVLWTRFHKFDAADPRWPDRDRFILSAGHGSMLLYALLHLTGHAGMGIDEIKRFRQLNSPAAGHPEFGEHPGIESTTGPLGQGIGTAVGMALAERMLAARFGRSLVDHRTWVIASDGDLMEGISHEAASLAGHLRLEKLTVIWNDNSAAGENAPALATSDDQLKRFAAYGWAVKQVDGHDSAQLAAALSMAIRSKKPTLIAARTTIGFATLAKSGAAPIDSAPLGPDMALGAKQALGWDHPPFELPTNIVAQWQHAGLRGAAARRGWLKRLARHPQRAEFERVIAGKLPDTFHDAIAACKAEIAESHPTLATHAASQRVLEALVPAMPELIGGAADLNGATLTQVRGMPAVTPGVYAGRYVHYGVREHGMAAAMNGIALHGGLLPYGGTFFVFTDYMRPALRLAAIMRQRVIHVLTHDSIGLGEDGAAHQPVEHLASLRAMPNVQSFVPATRWRPRNAGSWRCAVRRGRVCWRFAGSRSHRCAPTPPRIAARAAATCSPRPTARATRRSLPAARRWRSPSPLATRSRPRAITVAVVSLPCWELFSQQDEAYRAQVLGGVLRVGVEAASGFGWERWLGADGVFIGMTGFGASGACDDVYRHFGITSDAIAAAVRRRVGENLTTKKD